MNRNLSCQRAPGPRSWVAAVVATMLAVAASLGATESPGGFTRFDELQEQFTIAVPEGWHSYNQIREMDGTDGPAGRVIFSAEEIPGLHLARVKGTDYEIEYKDPERSAAARGVALELDTGRLPSFIVDRIPLQRSRKGMSCASFTKRFARSAALYQVGPDRGLSGRAAPVQFPDGFEIEPIAKIGGCQGFRIRGESTIGETPGGAKWVVDVRAVSDGKTLFLFIARGLEENLPAILETFETSLKTLELASAGH